MCMRVGSTIRLLCFFVSASNSLRGPTHYLVVPIRWRFAPGSDSSFILCPFCLFFGVRQFAIPSNGLLLVWWSVSYLFPFGEWIAAFATACERIIRHLQRRECFPDSFAGFVRMSTTPLDGIGAAIRWSLYDVANHCLGSWVSVASCERERNKKNSARVERTGHDLCSTHGPCTSSSFDPSACMDCAK